MLLCARPLWFMGDIARLDHEITQWSIRRQTLAVLTAAKHASLLPPGTGKKLKAQGRTVRLQSSAGVAVSVPDDAHATVDAETPDATVALLLTTRPGKESAHDIAFT